MSGLDAVTRSLEALRDVRGVEGTFYASRDGKRCVRDLPAVYADEPLDGVSARLLRLVDALVDEVEEPDTILFRHGAHLLCVRPTETGVLVVLASGDVSLPALRRGVSLVARRLPDLASFESEAPRRGAHLPPPVPPRFAPTRVLGEDVSRSTPPPIPYVPPALMASSEVPSSAPPARISAPPDLTREASSPGSEVTQQVAKNPPVQRASVPGAPAAPARKWRGSTIA